MSTFDTEERINLSMSYYLSRVNKGQGFYAVVTDADLDIAVPLTLTFTTPAAPRKFLRDVRIAAHNTNPATLEVLEAPTVTVDTGSDVTPLNQNRNRVTTSGVWSMKTVPIVNQMTKGVTITVDGTSLRNVPFGIAATNNEYILELPVIKLDTTYTIRFTTTVDDSIGDISITWLEYVWG
jgi:hypothetical protein